MASTGKAGLDEVAREAPFLILLDMKMPVMDGWEFVQRLRAERGDVAPILIVSAAEEAKAWVKEIGATGLLSKPFDIDELLRCVKRFVKKQ